MISEAGHLDVIVVLGQAHLPRHGARPVHMRPVTVLESVRAKADGQVARAEGTAELAAARAEEVSRLVSQLAELRAGTRRLG